MARPLYIVLRNDLLGMSPGRAIAQGSHGTSEFHEAFRQLNVATASSYAFMKQAFLEWKNETGEFGTTIVLQGDRNEIRALELAAEEGVRAHPEKFAYWHKTIVDPEYHVVGVDEIFVGRNITTGIVFFLPEDSGSNYNENLFASLKGFKLY